MSLSRREFMQLLAAASAAGMALDHRDALAASAGAGERLYDVPKFGNVSFLSNFDHNTNNCNILSIHNPNNFTSINRI